MERPPFRVVTLRFHPAEGGVETRTREVYGRLARRLPLEVVASDLKRDRPFERLDAAGRALASEAAPTIHIRARRFLPLEGYGTLLTGLAGAIDDARAVMAHSYGYHHTDATGRIAARRGIPAALTTHFHPPDTAGHPMLRRAYDATIGRRTIHRYDALVAMTDHEKRELAQRFGYPPDRIHVIPSGVDFATFRELGLERDPATILFVGRLSPVKGLLLLVEAMADVVKEVPEARLVAVGEDWGVRREAEARARHHGIGDRVAFEGRAPKDRLVELYNRATLFALPSRYEAFGVAAAEAIACGLPCVVSPVGGLPFVVGNAGLVVERSVQAFAHAIVGLLSNGAERRRLAEATVRERARFDWDAIAAAEERLLLELEASA